MAATALLATRLALAQHHYPPPTPAPPYPCAQPSLCSSSVPHCWLCSVPHCALLPLPLLPLMPPRARSGHPFNVTVYHVNEGSYGAAPINMNTADLNGVRCCCLLPPAAPCPLPLPP